MDASEPAMKLVIQIPCWNEEATLPLTVASLPRQVDGFDEVEVLVIDDGSTDATSKVAYQLGVDCVVKLPGHRGLARAFMAGVTACLDRGADVIVNTDADNQYEAADIPALVQPILDGRADLVIGARPMEAIAHFSAVKKFLQRLGSRVVRAVSGTHVQDATSGFRAFSREAALRLNVFSRFTYTLETVIQAGLCQLRVADVPIRVNKPLRPSRLFRSNTAYVLRSLATIVSAYLLYRPMPVFHLLSAAFLLPAALLALRYLYFMAIGEGTGHVQSVITSAFLAVCGVFTLAIGLIVHFQSINRRLLEEVQFLLRTSIIHTPSPAGDLSYRPPASSVAAADALPPPR